MSESIWNREIEQGLKDFLSTFMLYSNGENKGKPIPIHFRSPDEDFKEESYPVIYIQSLQQRFSTVRYNPVKKVVSRNREERTVTVEEAPLPFDCSYQIDFYSLKAGEINDMLQQFLAHTHGGRYFNLPVKDQSGNDWDLLVLRRGGTMMRRDYMNDTDRIFHGMFNFTVQTQLNENVRETKSMVIERELVHADESIEGGS